jgi:NUMOD3 motif
MTTAYVYKWTHVPTMMWYVGSRTAKGCHIDDGYICSSKYVKPLILESKNEWKREIIATGSVKEMTELETEILQLFDAKHDPISLNKHNGDGKFSVAGKKLGPRTEEHRANLSASKKGRAAWNKGMRGIFTHSEESKKAISLYRTGKQWDKQTKEKISLTEKRSKKSIKINKNQVNPIGENI